MSLPPYLVDGGLKRRHGLERRELDHERDGDDDNVLHDAARGRLGRRGRVDPVQQR